jgi:AAA+ ATPase superfamily predicted ATPase
MNSNPSGKPIWLQLVEANQSYIELAKEASIEPLDALNSMRSMLSDPWNEPEYFLAALGKDDILAIIEARRHFHLPPLE